MNSFHYSSRSGHAAYVNKVAGAPNNHFTIQIRTNATITSVCDLGGQDGCAEPETTPGTIKTITINGTGLVGSSGGQPAVVVSGPNGATLNAQVIAAGANRIDATVTVPDDAALADYDVAVYPNGSVLTGSSFLGTQQQPGSANATARHQLKVVDNPITITYSTGSVRDQMLCASWLTT